MRGAPSSRIPTYIVGIIKTSTLTASACFTCPHPFPTPIFQDAYQVHIDGSFNKYLFVPCIDDTVWDDRARLTLSAVPLAELGITARDAACGGGGGVGAGLCGAGGRTLVQPPLRVLSQNSCGTLERLATRVWRLAGLARQIPGHVRAARPLLESALHSCRGSAQLGGDGRALRGAEAGVRELQHASIWLLRRELCHHRVHVRAPLVGGPEAQSSLCRGRLRRLTMLLVCAGTRWWRATPGKAWT